MNEIEKLARKRRNILLGVLIGAAIAFGLFIFPTFFPFTSYQWIRYQGPLSYPFFKGALLAWLLTILIFTLRYLMYKKMLKKEPSLYTAVYDERIKLNWLKSYRFAFYTGIFITIFWKLVESPLLPANIQLPHGPWLILSSATLSLVGSFLYYNRAIKDE